MSSITGANAIIMLSIPGLFTTPQQLQGFAADDIFDTDALASTEVLMGVDGKMSAGFVFVPMVQNYSLQADSPSCRLFEQWWAFQQEARDVFRANGIVVLTAVGSKWTLRNGALTGFSPIPGVKKLVQPRRFTITWESALPSLT